MAETEYQHVPRTESEMLNLLNDLTTPLEGNIHRDIVGSLFELILRSMVDAGYTDVQVELAKGGFKDLASRLDASDFDMRNISVEWINKNLGKLDQTFMSEEFLQQMAGTTPINAVPADYSVTNQKVAEKSISPDKTTFAKRGKNEFDGNWLHGVTMLGSPATQGTLMPHATGKGYTTIFKADAGGTYTISKKAGSSNRFRIGASVGRPAVQTEGIGIIRYISTLDTIDTLVVNLQESENHIVVYVSDSAEDKLPEEFQIEKRSFKTAYEPPNRAVLEIENQSILPEKMIGVSTVGVLTGGSHNFVINAETKVITTLGAGGFVNAGVSRYFLKDGSWSYAEVSADTVVIAFDRANSDILFYASSQIVEADKRNLTLIGIIRQNEGKMWISGIYSEYNPPKRNFYIADDLSGLYTPVDSTYISPWEATVTSVYAIFDDLVTRFPEYVKRTLWGSVSGLPIYQYDFKPGNVKIAGVEQVLPHFFITNTHSFERPALLGMARFWKDLCDNWKSSSTLRAMRWNVHFTVVPILNPWGLNNVSRPNENGVDLARNQRGWSLDGENGNPEGVTYAGPSMYSEQETQWLKQYMDNNVIDFAIDFHNYTNLEVSDSVLWLGSGDRDMQRYTQGYAQLMSSVTYSQFIDGKVSGYENSSLGLIVKSVRGGSTTYAWETIGVKSVILELVSDFGTNNTEVQTFTMQSLGNLILTGLKNLI